MILNDYIRKSLLAILFSMLLDLTFGQENRIVEIEGINTFKLNVKEGESLDESIMIKAELKDTFYDSCNYFNNNLLAEIYLDNTGDVPILIKPVLHVYNDSGFGSIHYNKKEISQLFPSKTIKIKIRIINTFNRDFHKTGFYTIYYDDEKINIPISVSAKYNYPKCDEVGLGLLTLIQF